MFMTIGLVGDAFQSASVLPEVTNLKLVSRTDG
jgi:hypothetical protein